MKMKAPAVPAVALSAGLATALLFLAVVPVAKGCTVIAVGKAASKDGYVPRPPMT